MVVILVCVWCYGDVDCVEGDVWDYLGYCRCEVVVGIFGIDVYCYEVGGVFIG